MGCRVLGDRGYIMQMVSCGPNNVIIVFASCIMCKWLLVLSQNTCYQDTFSSCIILYPAMLLWDIGAICESATSFLAGFSPHLHTSSFSSLLFACTRKKRLVDIECLIRKSIAIIFISRLGIFSPGSNRFNQKL